MPVLFTLATPVPIPISPSILLAVPLPIPRGPTTGHIPINFHILLPRPISISVPIPVPVVSPVPVPVPIISSVPIPLVISILPIPSPTSTAVSPPTGHVPINPLRTRASGFPHKRHRRPRAISARLAHHRPRSRPTPAPATAARATTGPGTGLLLLLSPTRLGVPLTLAGATLVDAAVADARGVPLPCAPTAAFVRFGFLFAFAPSLGFEVLDLVTASLAVMVFFVVMARVDVTAGA